MLRLQPRELVEGLEERPSTASASLATKIRIRLAATGKSAAGASLEAGLSRSAIQDILKGYSESPRLDTIQRLAGPLQCTVAFLVGCEGAETPPAAEVEKSRFRNPLLEASNTIEQAKGLCWATRMALSDLSCGPHRDGLRAIEDALMEKLETIGIAVDQARGPRS